MMAIDSSLVFGLGLYVWAYEFFFPATTEP
jgi:hypothetical protein